MAKVLELCVSAALLDATVDGTVEKSMKGPVSAVIDRMAGVGRAGHAICYTAALCPIAPEAITPCVVSAWMGERKSEWLRENDRLW